MTFDSSIHVRVVHQDPLSRAGLIAALTVQPGFDVVEEGDRDGAPAVIVADWDKAIELARARRPGSVVAVVIVFGANREWDLRRALDCNIEGYLTPGFSPGELADAIKTVCRGARYLCARAAARLAESVVFETLTDREADVLRLVVEGLCNKAIARELDIALGTVKSHLKSAYDKLSVASRTQAIAATERRGLLERRVRPGESGRVPRTVARSPVTGAAVVSLRPGASTLQYA